MLLDWLTTAMREVWPNQHHLQYLTTSWKMYAELQQVLQELGMKNIIYNMDPEGLDKGLFT